MAFNVPKHLLLITADYNTNVTVTCQSRCSLLIAGRVASAGGARQDPGGYQREDGLHHEQGVPGRGVHHGERRAPQCSAAGGRVRDLQLDAGHAAHASGLSVGLRERAPRDHRLQVSARLVRPGGER